MALKYSSYPQFCSQDQSHSFFCIFPNITDHTCHSNFHQNLQTYQFPQSHIRRPIPDASMLLVNNLQLQATRQLPPVYSQHESNHASGQKARTRLSEAIRAFAACPGEFRRVGRAQKGGEEDRHPHPHGETKQDQRVALLASPSQQQQLPYGQTDANAVDDKRGGAAVRAGEVADEGGVVGGGGAEGEGGDGAVGGVGAVRGDGEEGTDREADQFVAPRQYHFQTQQIPRGGDPETATTRMRLVFVECGCSVYGGCWAGRGGWVVGIVRELVGRGWVGVGLLGVGCLQMLMGVVDLQLQVTLTSIQLAAYVVLLLLAGVKLVKAVRNARKFLPRFYCCVSLVAALQVALQSYQLSCLLAETDPSIYVFMIINLYVMTVEAATIFLLGDYWYETGEILTKQSTETEVQEQRKWARPALLGFWLLGFSCFVGWALAAGGFGEGRAVREVLALGCQGVGAVLVGWAVVLQVLRGRHLSSAVSRYEEWLNSVSIRKFQFRLLFWVTSIANLARLLFLISVTIAFEFQLAKPGWEWLAAYIYTFTNCLVLPIYIFGFSTKPVDSPTEPLKKSTLLQGSPNHESSSNRSRHETELSSSSNRTN